VKTVFVSPLASVKVARALETPLTFADKIRPLSETVAAVGARIVTGSGSISGDGKSLESRL